MMTATAIKILQIQRDVAEARLLRETFPSNLKKEFNIQHVGSLAAAMRSLEHEDYDVILLDPNLPDSYGIATFHKIAKQAPRAAIILLTDHDESALGVEAMLHGAQSYWLKGEIRNDLLIRAVKQALVKQREENTFKQTYGHDPLTCLPNRTIFLDRMRQAIRSAGRYKRSVAVLCLRLDRFKRINESLGHAVGDKLLQGVSDRLSHTLYETDTITRIGGGVFSILLPQLETTEAAIKVANKLIGTFQTPFVIDGYELYMNCTVGISLYPNDGNEPEELLKNANSAMNRLKGRGISQYQLYCAAMNTSSLEKLELENSLRYALGRCEFRLYYQPFFDARNGAVTGMEALLRWQHPTRGLLAPHDFLSLAEETGLIIPIGAWVLKTACAQNKNWQEEGFPPMRVAVNLSDLQFHDYGLIDLVDSVLQETRLESSYLELELTENIVMKKTDESLRTLAELKSMGLSVAIDDFGIGYSSLGSLQRLPISTLKIDRCFVHSISDTMGNGAIAKAIISMAHSLQLEVIAEGVETSSQLEFLRRNSCDKIQGYLVGQPVPAETFTQLLQEKFN